MSTQHTILSWFENKEEEQKLIDHLQKHKYRCISCGSKAHFDELINSADHSISLVIIDLDIRETDAILVCNEVKSRKDTESNPFVVIVSDKAEEFTQVTALDLGADDYIIKPLKPQLFLKRLEAILSRKLHPNEKNNVVHDENLYIDLERHLIIIDNETFELPKKEFELMNLFYSVPNKIFSREEIAVVLWNEERIARQRTIDVHIRNIRKILGRDLIKTVKGFGYGLNKIST
ncbi:MAG: response regulator transcription factor [Bacteroidia bacterium]